MAPSSSPARTPSSSPGRRYTRSCTRCNSTPELIMSLDAWFQGVWYGAGTPPWWLRAFSPGYGAVVRLRRWLYARGWLRTLRVAAPVIIVGNLTVGGTGKTPLVIWLVGKLRGLGLAVAVVT